MTVKRALRSLLLASALGAGAIAAAEVGLRLARFGVDGPVLGPWGERPEWQRIRTLDEDGTPWPVPAGAGRWSLQPGEPSIDYRLDARGFRVGERARHEHREGPGCEVLAVGDSATFGYGVRAEEALPAQLADALRGDGVVATVDNAGICASNVRHQRQWLEHILEKTAPRVVVITETPWSLRLDPPPTNSGARFADKLWNVTEARTRSLAGSSATADRASRAVFHLSSRMIGWPSGSVVSWELAPLLESREQFASRWRDVARELERMVALVRARGATPVLVLVPLDLQLDIARNRLYRDERLPYPSYGFEERDYTADDRYSAAMRALARELDVALVDETAPLRTRVDQAFLRADYHPSAAGYRQIAADLAPVVAEACRRACAGEARNR